jgi:nucleotide-binding universal stress UspA family protein
MLQLKTILVPIDFSDRSRATAEHAVHMANRFQSNLILVHVKEPIAYQYAEYTFAPGAEAEINSHNQREMAELVKAVTLGRPIETLLLEGEPARRIETLIRERKVDLVMMATHGYGTFRRFIVGSVTAKVLHDTACPVFTGAHVPEVAKVNPEPYKRVACAIDLKEGSERILRWAADFAKAWEADLLVLHAAPTLEVGENYSQWFPENTRAMIVGHAKQEIEKLAATAGCKPEVRVETADVGQFVKDKLDKSDADVLVIGRSRDTGVLGRLRTHAYALIRESPCPVISV